MSAVCFYRCRQGSHRAVQMLFFFLHCGPMAAMADSPALPLGGTWNAWGLLSRDHQQCVLVPTELLPEGWLWVWASVSGSSSNTTSNFRCASASRRLSLSQQNLGLSPKVTPGRKEAQFHRATLTSSYLIRHWTEMWPCFVHFSWNEVAHPITFEFPPSQCGPGPAASHDLDTGQKCSTSHPIPDSLNQKLLGGSQPSPF